MVGRAWACGFCLGRIVLDAVAAIWHAPLVDLCAGIYLVFEAVGICRLVFSSLGVGKPWLVADE
jgi:hypothetical protein